MPVMTLKMPDELARKIRLAAEKLSTSRSAIVRRAVERYIDEGLAQSDELSAYGLAKEFAGRVKGPRDLSTNPRHMKDYGG